MAKMICCAQDWTYDLFVEDVKMNRSEFANWFNWLVSEVDHEWFVVNGRKAYDRQCGWIGDAFSCALSESFFSDYYKDTYGQRPHLPLWFYVRQSGFPSSEDTARLFCSNPIEDAVESAREMRAYLESL